MKHFAIPSCYFPSTVVFIDDSKEFLANFTLQLPQDLAYQIYDSPFEALETIFAKQHESDKLQQRCVSEYVDADTLPMTNQTINLNLSAIHSEIYNPQRFSEVSVVVVDYAMPGMNGIEFCKRLENSSIKRILLTGKADEKTAIQAFNDGLIHRYVQKSDPNVAKLINDSIRDLQKQYFQNMSDMIIRMLAVNSPNCLTNEIFAEFFKGIREQYNIVEFYITDSSGSFLMLDAEATPYLLIMKNKQDLQMHYDLALDNRAPKEVLKALEAGERIPYFSHTNGYNGEWSDWNNWLLPAKQVQFDQTYFYAVVKNPLSPEIRPDRVLSYNDYLENMDRNLKAVA